MYARKDGAKKQRLLIADDHPAMVEGIRVILEDEFEVAGSATNGRDLLDLAADLNPDAVILDIQLPLLNGFETARNLRSRNQNIKILMYTFHDGAEYVREALSAGASGYILKGAPKGELSKGLREILRGNRYLPGGVSALPYPDAAKRGASELFRELTPRQREVLQLVCEGKSAKMIAGILSISSKTVEFHKASMLDALNVSTTAELIRYAVERGMFGLRVQKPISMSAGSGSN